jgi:NarL family two-component system response regulator LiaR
MPHREPIRLLVVDDHGVVRQGVRAFLDTHDDIRVVAEASDGASAVARSAEHAPDVALVDLKLPDIDGVETTRRIKAASPCTQVIILTSLDDQRWVLPAIQAGAVSYLMKDAAPEALVGAVRKAARGEAVLDPKVAAQLLEAVRRPERDAEALAPLSQREREVLMLIAQGLSNAAIAERLAIGEKTVKSHVSNVLAKLQLADRTQAAVYAWKRGLMRDKGET